MRIALLLLVLFVGCVKAEPVAVALPVPPAQVPTVDVPMELRYRNWGGGSCVYASLCQLLEAHNRHGDAAWIRQNCAGSAGPAEIIAVCQRLGIEYDTSLRPGYRVDPGFLDWADKNGYGAIIWWKTKHCCTFEGWIVRNGTVYASILDNNYPDRRELVERNEFVRRWAGEYGGFALAPMCDLATIVPFKAYELTL